MQRSNTLRNPAQFAVALVALVVVALSGCERKSESGAATFGSPDDAVAALITALQKDDAKELARVLGPGTDELVSSGDPVADKSDRARFVAAYQARHSLQDDGAGRKTLVVGEDDWPMPIPLVRRDGRWLFDGAEGADEIIYRRVGTNELGAIDVCRGFVNAQHEYASTGHDGDPPGIYALKLLSDEGLHNGLYWATAEGEEPSPAGPFVADAAAEGYRSGSGARAPYHGYFYRMLYAQGPNANGGAREYFRNGLLTEGFALIAWPADYGSSGVQTFICNQDGVVFQKDLGDDTATIVETIKVYDPDSTWIAVVTPDEPATAGPSPPAG